MSTAARKHDYVSEEDYLAGELQSEVRHEYLGGEVYAMAGETRTHNTISLNLALALRHHLCGGSCRTYIADIRLSLSLHSDRYYYYPDLVVTCDARDQHPRFVHHPKLLIEVLSESTQRVDRREKFFAYTTLEALEEYVLVEQDKRELTVFRRSDGWKGEVVAGPDASVRFESIGLTLPLGTVYEGL